MQFYIYFKCILVKSIYNHFQDLLLMRNIKVTKYDGVQFMNIMSCIKMFTQNIIGI
jgi:hypothetical protein